MVATFFFGEIFLVVSGVFLIGVFSATKGFLPSFLGIGEVAFSEIFKADFFSQTGVCGKEGGLEGTHPANKTQAVSYTHLTLPTN